MGRGRQWCNGREGDLLHNNQQKDGARGHVAKGEAWNVVIGIGGEANNFYEQKIIIITHRPRLHITRDS
jgi:hypothetical protein